jgi:putative endonuclease
VPHTGTWWLYVLECQGGILYTGIAKDVDARFAAHLAGTGAIFTRLNRPLRILAKAIMPTQGDALRAEYAFKQAPRAAKLQWCASHVMIAEGRSRSTAWRRTPGI